MTTRETEFAPSRRGVLKGAAVTAAGLFAGPRLIGRARASTPGHINFGLSSYPPTLEQWRMPARPRPRSS